MPTRGEQARLLLKREGVDRYSLAPSPTGTMRKARQLAGEDRHAASKRLGIPFERLGYGRGIWVWREPAAK